MGDGQLCYGILFEENYEFPWDSREWDGDIDNWWLYKVHRYTNPFELFDEEGNWINGVEPAEEIIDQYYGERRKFRENRPPLPVELVNCRSCDYPIYILAIPDSVRIAHRGYPRKVIPVDFSSLIGGHDLLIRFCHVHNIKVKDEPRWWLSSL